MSRRKQARPRHLEDELDSTCPATAERKDEVIEEGPEQPEMESPVTQLSSFHDNEETEKVKDPLSDDAHVCGKCRAEFLILPEFLAHKKMCGKQQTMIMYEDDQHTIDRESSVTNGLHSPFVAETEMDNLEAASQNGGSDGEQNFENLGTEEDEIRGDDDVNDFDGQLGCDDYDEIDDELKSMTGDENEDENYKDEELFDEKIKEDLSQLPPYMLPLANMLPGTGTTNSNVLLEPLEATKAAVAQFAENNLPSTDVTVLHSTLYNLQQQQIMQMQLIQQLQQQLVASQMQNGQPPSGLTSLQLALPTTIPPPPLPSSNESSSKSVKSQVTSPSNDTSGATDKEQITPAPQKASTQPSETKPSPPSSAVTTSPTRPTSSSWSTPTTSHRTNGHSSSGGTGPLMDFSRTQKLLDRNQFVSDDPFFKHKCRLCHKVFGSDSALQIHVRSHTDIHGPKGPLNPGLSSLPTLPFPDLWTWEKPFKCNICGGRFSTRGNLKVHFQRHKAEFPDVEMNPNPVPEHLDKMPLLGSPFPPSSITPFSTPNFMGMHGLMNGLLFPPPNMTPRPPSSSHLSNHLPPHIRPHPLPEEKRASSPGPDSKQNVLPNMKRSSSPSLKSSSVQPKREPPSLSPTTKELPHRSSPNNMRDTLPQASSSLASLHSMNMSLPFHLSHPGAMMPMGMPLVSNFPIMSSLPSRPPYPPPPNSSPMSLSSQSGGADPFKNSILPASILDNDENLEQFMEINKSETSKLQQLVDNIEHKLTDPNQCVICHRVLSCKSALQMHYRIHTGERPFKCKICGRAFTTKGNLKTHMGVHRAKPPLRMMHQCPVCHKQFTNLLVLQQHIRSHTGISSLPSVPSLTHMHMHGRPGFDSFQHRAINMTRPYPDSDKELDLSKKPRLDMDNGIDRRSNLSEDRIDEDMDTDVNMDDDLDEEEDELNNMDEEANSFAARVLKRNDNDSPTSASGRSSVTSKRKEDQEDDDKTDRLKSFNSRDDSQYKDSTSRPESPKYLQEAPSPQGDSQDGSYSLKSYSTSLAALEERVRAIDSSMARNPLSQFHAAPFMLGPGLDGLMTNGERSSISPRSHPPSESGSDDNHRDDGLKPSTPALSCSSEGSGSNFMLGALDLRSQDGTRTPTTCNVCFKTFACRSALDIHYRSHTKERPYKCDLCDRSFTTRGNMKQHMLTHKIRDMQSGDESSSQYERNNNNSCTPNKNDQSSSENSNEESPHHFDESRIKKEQLTPTFSEKVPTSTSPPSSSTTAAAASSVSAGPSLSSSVTPSSSSNKSSSSSRDRDTSSHHESPFLHKSTPTIKHQCMVCQKGFSSASALQIHTRTHTGDKPFKCNVCGKAFTTKGNLKVHMGTHMWNNSPSRRGRRMSIEPPFMLAHKDNPYMTPGFPPRHDFYPFQFPPFMNGLPTPPKSLNEISVIQGLGNGLGGPMVSGMKPELISPRGERLNGKAESPDSNDDRQKFATESGELDLSMKSIGSSGSRDSKTSPSSVDSGSSSQGMLSPTSHSSSLGWGWKASCHLCSRSFPTPTALDHHMRSMHMMGEAHKVAAS